MIKIELKVFPTIPTRAEEAVVDITAESKSTAVEFAIAPSPETECNTSTSTLFESGTAEASETNDLESAIKQQNTTMTAPIAKIFKHLETV